MSINLAAWNVEGRLSRGEVYRRGTVDHIMDGIEKLNADVVVLPEAFDVGLGLDPRAKSRMLELGYRHTAETEYVDRGERPPGAVASPLAMIIASRIALVETEVIRLANLRNMLRVQVKDRATNTPVNIYGVHFDDRSKQFRMRQIEDLAEIMKRHSEPSAVIGDYNSMTGEGIVAKTLRSKIASIATSVLPGEVGYVAQRALDMASGDELRRMYELTNFRNVDPSGAPTTTPKLKQMPAVTPSIRMLDIDHLLVSPEIDFTDFAIMKKDGGSDHRAISATISVASPH